MKHLKKIVFVLIVILITFYIVLNLRYFNQTEPVVVGVTLWDHAPVCDENIRGFKKAFENAGYFEGQDVIFDIRLAERSPEKQRQIIQSFVNQKVDLIFTMSTPTTMIAKEVSPNGEIPIVFSMVPYPVEVGLVTSLKYSDNHLTGARNWVSMEKQLNTFLDLVPNIQNITFMSGIDEKSAAAQWQELEEVSMINGIKAIPFLASDLKSLLEQLDDGYHDIEAIYISCDHLMYGGGEALVLSYAKKHKIPVFSCMGTTIDQGALVVIVTDYFEIGKMAGDKAIKILDGVDPGLIEINTAHQSSIYINQTVADDLGIIIPQDIYSKASRIIY